MTVKQVSLIAAIFFIFTLATERVFAFSPPNLGEMDNAPLYTTCGVHYPEGGNPYEALLGCNWIAEYPVKVWDDREGEYVNLYSTALFVCRGTHRDCVGTGVNRGIEMGRAPLGDNGVINLWHYVDSSTEGLPVAYRYDQGPYAGKPRVSYMEAANHIVDYYLRYGATEEYLKRKLDYLFMGGAEEYMASVNGVDTHADPTPQGRVSGPVTEAWCNPRADDDCSVNGVSVPMAKLTDYLPKVSEQEVESKGGLCEYPICYDADYKPIGVRDTMF